MRLSHTCPLCRNSQRRRHTHATCMYVNILSVNNGDGNICTELHNSPFLNLHNPRPPSGRWPTLHPCYESGGDWQFLRSKYINVLHASCVMRVFLHKAPYTVAVWLQWSGVQWNDEVCQCVKAVTSFTCRQKSTITKQNPPQNQLNTYLMLPFSI